MTRSSVAVHGKAIDISSRQLWSVRNLDIALLYTGGSRYQHVPQLQLAFVKNSHVIQDVGHSGNRQTGNLFIVLACGWLEQLWQRQQDICAIPIA